MFLTLILLEKLIKILIRMVRLNIKFYKNLFNFLIYKIKWDIILK
jgi:hypothetical protein